MGNILKFKQEYDDAVFEYEIIPPILDKEYTSKELDEISKNEELFRELLAENDEHVKELNKQIDNLTNHADGTDYAVAICSGAIAGAVDILYVGELDFSDALKPLKEKGAELAKNIWGDVSKEDLLKGALNGLGKYARKISPKLYDEIRQIVSKYGEFNPDFPQADYINNLFGTDTADTIPDIDPEVNVGEDVEGPCSIMGIFISLLNQFLNSPSGFSDPDAKFFYDEDADELFGGDIRWKIISAVTNWLGRYIRDIQNKSISDNELAGIPDFIKKTIGEASNQKIFNEMSLPKVVNELSKRNDVDISQLEKMIQPGVEVAKLLSKQALPVLIDEVLVRGFYFLRKFVSHIRNGENLLEIPMSDCLPIGNRTVERMITVSLGTMEAFDIGDATIRGAIDAYKAGSKAGSAAAAGGPYAAAGAAATAATIAFVRKFAVRVNYVGVGSFTVAGCVDIGMGIKRDQLRNQRLALYTEKLNIANSQMYFQEANMWVAAAKAGESINEAYALIDKTKEQASRDLDVIDSSVENIEKYTEDIEKNNKGLVADMLDTLKWGV